MKIFSSEEKKVEYLELIYDLIFVYIIGRNNSLLHHLEGGFVSGSVFFTYILCSLAIIQIWNFSTFYTNMFGRNSVRDHVFMFINMFLLYYVGEGTRVHWQGYQNQYHIAWTLILVNTGIQYLIELRSHRDNPDTLRTIRGLIIALFGEAAIVLAAVPIYNRTGVPLAAAAILFGIAATWRLTGKAKISRVDFAHLAERAMLYVVFTFGEMIIVIASYFEEDFGASQLYFSLMSFLIVVGLFLSYEVLYNRILDKDKQTSGMSYMMIHIVLIFAMNCVTTSLEFMRDPMVLLWSKIIFLVASFLLFFGSMFALLYFAKPQMRHCKKFILPVAAVSAAFAVLMILARNQMHVNIALSVLYVFFVFFLLFRYSKRGGTQQ